MKGTLAHRLAAIRQPFTTQEALAHGISRATLFRAVKDGRLLRRCHGVYELPDAPDGNPNRDFETLAVKGVPFVVSLVSALYLHGITTQVPRQIWIALPPGTRTPVPGSVPVECQRVKEPAYSFGARRMDLGGFSVPVYSPAKTVADCFKFRGKVGLDVSLEALHDGWRQKKFTVDELMEAARVDRVERIVRPYAEGMLAP